LISPDKTRREPITLDGDKLDIQPTFSPDGRKIAFIRGEGPKGPTSVCVCNVDGSELRELVPARQKGGRLASPVWISNSTILYTRNPRPGRAVEMEVWRVDLSDDRPRRIFGFREKLGKDMGLVTDISPDHRQLLAITQTRGVVPTSDVSTTDLNGNLLVTLTTGSESQHINARALWSPDGQHIAWCHFFTAASSRPNLRYGVGLVKLGSDERWTTQLQSEEDTLTTPLAWSPDGRYLLCAQIEPADAVLVPATLVLMDNKLRPVGELFKLESTTWGPKSKDFGRLADWAVIPEEALPEKLQSYNPSP
jgi:Tol biopolymer transport system component